MVYTPSEDTFLLLECLGRYHGKQALEIGVGSGLVAKALERRFESVAASDIDIAALYYCKRRTEAMLVCCDAASAFADKKLFDLIVSNPPYLPNDYDSIHDSAVHGGPTGVEETIRFIKTALPLLSRNGSMLIVVSSLSDSSALERFLSEAKISRKIVGEKRLFFETLSVIELGRQL
jgi:release factor glutamine methyltransferase